VSETTPSPTSKFGAILATTKTHKWYWIGGGSVVVVAAVAAGLYFGGVFGFSGRDICMATLSQAKDFGVISPGAELSGFSAKSTDVKGRRSCTAKVGDDIFTLLTDLKSEDSSKKPCKDLKKQNSCVALYSVARSDGVTTYQVRAIPPDETDEALAARDAQSAANQPQGGAMGAPAEGQQGGGLDTETAVDNSASNQQAPAQPAQQPQQ
jgi:hypothetical protein